jgi:hypothetical protein
LYLSRGALLRSLRNMEHRCNNNMFILQKKETGDAGRREKWQGRGGTYLI